MSTSGGTPLMYAAKDDDIESIKALLELGADPKLRDNDGDNARDYAEAYGCKRAFNFLKQLGSKPKEPAKPTHEQAESISEPPALRMEWDMDVGEAHLLWKTATDTANPSRSTITKIEFLAQHFRIHKILWTHRRRFHANGRPAPTTGLS